MGKSSKAARGMPLYEKDAGEYSEVFIANGKHGVGRCILCQTKKHYDKDLSVEHPR